MATELSEDQRTRLDNIVNKMLANGEPDENIRWVVNDFKQKYAVATPPHVSPPLSQSGVTGTQERWEAENPYPEGTFPSPQSRQVYEHYGVAVPEQQQPFPEAVKTAGSAIRSIGGPMVLPMAGQTGGALLGALAGPYAPYTVPAGEAMGGMLGEGANQLLGITPPSMTQIGLAGAAGPAGRAIGRVAQPVKQWFTRKMPGAGGALHEMALEGAAAKPATLLPAEASSSLYGQLTTNPPVAVPQLRSAVDAGIAQVTKASTGFRDKELYRRLVGLQRKLDATGNTLPLDELRSEMRGIGQAISESRIAGGPRLGSFKQLTRGAYDDIERAAASGVPEAGILKQANKAFAREAAADDLADVIAKQTFSSAGSTRFNPDKVAEWLEREVPKTELFRKAVTDAERQELIGFFKQLAKDLPKLPPPSGAQYGSARANIGMATAGGMASAMGAGASGVGIAVAAAAQAPQIIGRAAMTSTGRSLIRRLMQTKGMIDQNGLSLLSGALRAEAGPPIEQMLRGSPND